MSLDIRAEDEAATDWLNDTDQVRAAFEERMELPGELRHFDRSRRIAYASEIAWIASRLAQLEALDGKL